MRILRTSWWFTAAAPCASACALRTIFLWVLWCFFARKDTFGSGDGLAFEICMKASGSGEPPSSPPARVDAHLKVVSSVRSESRKQRGSASGKAMYWKAQQYASELFGASWSHAY